METTASLLSRMTTRKFLRTSLYRLENSPYSLKDYEKELIRNFAISLAVNTVITQCDRTTISPYSDILTAAEVEAISISAQYAAALAAMKS